MMTLHYDAKGEVQVDDTVLVRWGHFGSVTAKVVKVMPDGGLQLKRWNKRRGCYTTPKRYYMRADRRGWYEHDMSDPSKK